MTVREVVGWVAVILFVVIEAVVIYRMQHHVPVWG